MNTNVLNHINQNSNRNLFVDTKEARALNITVINTRENRRNRRNKIEGSFFHPISS